MGPLSLALQIHLHMVIWRGRKRVWIVGELEVHLNAFVYAVLLFIKPSHPSLSL